MANFFDQFDGAPPAVGTPTGETATPEAPTTQPTPNHFDQFDGQEGAFGGASVASQRGAQPAPPTKPGILANSPDDSTASSIAKGAATAGIKGAGSAALGWAGDMGGMVDYLLARGQSAITGQPVEEIMKAHVAMREAQKEHSRSTFGFAVPDAPTGEQVAAPLLEKTGQYEATTPLGRAAQMGVQSAVGGIGMGGGAGAMAGNFASGAAAQGVGEATGSPLAGLAAGVVAPAMGKIGGSAALNAGKDYIAPMVPRMREGAATEMLGKSATNPQEALNAAIANPSEIIPGSRPNLAEQTGDIGLAQATKAAGIANPNFAAGQMAAAGEQNAARAAAIRGTAAPDADVMQPSSFLNKQLSDIDAAHSQAIDTLAQRAKELNDSLPGNLDPEAVGNNLRTAVQGASDAAREARAKLYDLVDPDNKLSVVTAQARQAAADLQKSIDPSVTIPSPIATPVIGMVANLNDVTPFNKLTQLDTTITGAMAQAKRAGDNVGHAQLGQLKSAVMDSINNAVDNQAAWEKNAVASGALDPSNTITGRLKSTAPDADIGNTRGNSAASSAASPDGLPALAAPAGTRPMVGDIPSQGGSGGASGNQGIQSLLGPRGDNNPGAVTGTTRPIGGTEANTGTNPGNTGRGRGASPSGVVGEEPTAVPTFDEGAAERLRAAKQAHAEFAQTYRQAPVKPILDTNGFAGQYKMGASTIPAKAFPAGNTGYEITSAFLNAAKNSPEAVSAIQDMATDRLRSLMRGSDSLDPRVLDTWKRNYGQALKAIDEASPGFSSRFDDVATATKSLEDAQAAKVTAIKEAQEGAAGKLIGANTPDEVKARVGDMIRAKDGPTQIKAVLERVKGNEDAVAGLRKAGAEKILDDVTNAGTSGGERNISGAKLQTLLTKHGDAIEALFGKDGLDNMKAIAADIERSQKALDNTRARSGSDTGANIMKTMTDMAKRTGHVSVAGAMAIAGAEALSSGHLATASGVAGLAGLKAGLNKLRANGISKVQDLYQRALEDPEVGRAMLQTYINKHGAYNPTVMAQLLLPLQKSNRVNIAAQSGAEQYDKNRGRQQRKAGGRVGKSHEFLVNRLIKLADLAKKDQGMATKPLLGAPDELVVKALKLTGDMAR